MKKTVLRKLKDNQKFTLSKQTKIIYELNRLDRKTKTATYTSLASRRSFEKDWNISCFAL
jgi:hypothetical protein